jgi:mRNA-degrading endonuclease RelE of RelBE toxin-antitoxin system
VTAPGRQVRQVPRFRKAKRRLPGPIQDAVDEQVRRLVGNPLLGAPKTGALKGVRVVKFRGSDHQYLLAYQFFPKRNVIDVLDVGVHENFYRDLRGYFRDRPRGEETG